MLENLFVTKMIVIENWDNKPYDILLQLGYNYYKLSYCNELYVPN
jgi:hypothetical protein